MPANKEEEKENSKPLKFEKHDFAYGFEITSTSRRGLCGRQILRKFLREGRKGKGQKRFWCLNGNRFPEEQTLRTKPSAEFRSRF
ncbi:hypothetical protein V6N13_072717 [Hibiscus sabdariffa]|uniref:Uncharacterized protein n=1 Tax=Hibiscus sabdariffa TaxID=183260 RepID=A0ABR2E6Y8_9ROSI